MLKLITAVQIHTRTHAHTHTYIYIVYHKSEYTLTFLHIFKYISSWDNTDKMKF